MKIVISLNVPTDLKGEFDIEILALALKARIQESIQDQTDKWIAENSDAFESVSERGSQWASGMVDDLKRFQDSAEVRVWGVDIKQEAEEELP